MVEEKTARDSVARMFVNSLLLAFVSGHMNVMVNGFPAVAIDCDSKTLEIESSGVKQTGLSLEKLGTPQGGMIELIKESELTARKLAEDGWTLVVYDKGAKALTMGKGVSRLTGHVHVNMLKLRRLLSDSS